jgi:hypothetical protein
MNQEQQIYALMAIAEEQQRLITSHLEQQERSTNRLIQLEQQYMDKSQRIGTTRILITTVFCFAMAFLACFGAYIYLDAMKIEIYESRVIQRELAAKKADVSTCEKDGKSHPCIRVMTSWGAYGDHKDYFIIDPID